MTRCCENCNNAILNIEPFSQPPAQFVESCKRFSELTDEDFDDLDRFGYCDKFEELLVLRRGDSQHGYIHKRFN